MLVFYSISIHEVVKNKNVLTHCHIKINHMTLRHETNSGKMIYKKCFSLSHNKCNIAITILLVPHTCEIRFYDGIDESTNDVKAKILKYG